MRLTSERQVTYFIIEFSVLYLTALLTPSVILYSEHLPQDVIGFDLSTAGTVGVADIVLH
jgi:hypothetical protein